MASNSISTLATKELRQIAKLELAQTKRQQTGTPGYKENRYYDLDLLPTKYIGDAVVNNPNVGGLQAGRPWKTTPNVLSGLWRLDYDSYWRGPEYSNLDVSWFDSQTPVSGVAVDSIELPLGVPPNTSYQWLGYFRAPNTANYIFTAAGDDSSALWIGDKAITAYTIDNADILNIDNNDTPSDPIALTAGQYYPIRVIYGNGPSGGYFELSWQDDYESPPPGSITIQTSDLQYAGANWTGTPTLVESTYTNNNGWNYIGFDNSTLHNTFYSLLNGTGILGVTWGAGSSATNGYVLVNFGGGDGLSTTIFQFVPVVDTGGSNFLDGSWVFPATFYTLGP
jgi:hypothetical protein